MDRRRRYLDELYNEKCTFKIPYVSHVMLMIASLEFSPKYDA